MKRILCLSILIATYAWADEAAERGAIEQHIAAFNNHSKSVADLFTADAPESERAVLSAHEEPLSEVTPPKVLTLSVRFITPEVALVECVATEYGSLILGRSTPMLLVMKKGEAQWRIASLRVLGQSVPLAAR